MKILIIFGRKQTHKIISYSSHFFFFFVNTAAFDWIYNELVLQNNIIKFHNVFVNYCFIHFNSRNRTLNEIISLNKHCRIHICFTINYCFVWLDMWEFGLSIVLAKSKINISQSSLVRKEYFYCKQQAATFRAFKCEYLKFFQIFINILYFWKFLGNNK